MSSVISDAEKSLLEQAAADFGNGVINLGRDPSMYNMENVTLSVTFELNSLSGGNQTLLWNHTQYGILVDDGDLKVALRGDDGKLDYITVSDAFTDIGWHDVQVVLDSASGTLEFHVDGAVVYSGSSDGYNLESSSYWDVTAGGTAWGKELDGQIADVSIHDEAIEIDASASLYERMYALDEGDTVSGLNQPIETPEEEIPAEEIPPTPELSEEELLSSAATEFGDGVVKLGKDPSMFDLDSFTLSATFELNSLTSGNQAVLWNHKQYGIMVYNNDLKIALRGEDGKLDYIKVPDVFESAGWHDVQVVLDADAGTLDFWLDGVQVYSGSSAGFDIGSPSSWDVTSGGTPWGKALDGRVAEITILDEPIEIDSSLSTYERMLTVSGEELPMEQMPPVENTAADISGQDTGNIVEDANLLTTGKLTANDVDAGESGFQATSIVGEYGSFSIDGDGNWSFLALDNNALQALTMGDTVTEVFIVQTIDGTTKSVTVSIDGTDDIPVISGDGVANLVEDGGLTAQGSLSANDKDAGESAFQVSSIDGVYGTFSIDAGGNWTFAALDNDALQALGGGDTVTETFTVKTIDGTTKEVTIKIDGLDDVPVITGSDSGTVLEDVSMMASGSLTANDKDANESGFQVSTITGENGDFSIDANGNWTFTVADSDSLQAMSAGDTITEVFTVKTTDGTTKDVTITINGSDDMPVISGEDTGDIVEDSGLSVTGSLSAIDKDTGESGFVASTTIGSYGDFSIDANGNWIFLAADTDGLQGLGDGDTVSEVFTVQAIGGTTKQVTVTIHGTDDEPTITGSNIGSVKEDGALSATGKLTATDKDAGEGGFQAAAITGAFGSLSIDADGNWQYSATDSEALQSLGDGDSVTDTFTVTTVDGTPQEVAITLDGTNDVPVISGDDNASVEEDGDLTVSGSLSVVDKDTGESGFQASVETGTYGDFSIDTSGNWTYTAADTEALQALDSGDSFIETFTVNSLDGTTKNISVAVKGADEPPSEVIPPVGEDPEVGAGEILVTNAEELLLALESATGGETIVMQGGDYGDFHLDKMDYSSEVTIRSLNPADMATFNTIDLNAVSNLTIDSVSVDYTFEDGVTVRWTDSIDFRDCSNITVSNSVIEGDVATSGSSADTTPGEQNSNGNIIGYPAGTAIGLADSTNITLVGNDISNFSKGISLVGIDGLKIIDNEIHDLRSTPVRGGDVRNVLIEDNYFHSSNPWAFGGAGDHGDYVHLWIRPEQVEPSVNVVVKENFFSQGDGESLLGVYLDNNGLVDGVQFEDAVIDDNVIFTGNAQAIRLEGVDGVTISSNTLLQSSGDAQDAPGIVLAHGVKDAVIENNILSSDISEGDGSELNSNITESNNLIVQRQDPQGENYVGDLFVNPLDQTGTLDDLLAIPGSLVDTMGVGALATKFDVSPADVDGYMTMDAGTGANMMFRSFDALTLFGEEGALDLTGATVEWSFGDGTSYSGSAASHSFDTAGEFVVTAHATLADGREVTVEKMILIETPVALSTDFSSGFGDTSDVANNYVVTGAAEIVNIDGRDAVRVNDGVVSFDSNDELLNNAEYTVEFDFKKDVGAESTGGYAIYFSSSLMVNIKEDGLTVTVITDQGTVRLKPDGIGINDADWHHLSVSFSGTDGVVNVYVDGVVVAAAAELEGAVQVGSSSAEFNIGYPFGTGFAGVIDDVNFVRYSMSDEQVQASYQDVEIPMETPVESAEEVTVVSAVDEVITGTSGDDVLIGGEGDDTISGDDGSDFLTGGSGQDIFVYDEIFDSAVGLDKRDTISDFDALGGDQISLQGALDGTFNFIGSSEFSASGGSLESAADSFGNGIVNLGRSEDFFNLNDMTLSVTFELNDLVSGEQALVWNHTQYGVLVDGDDLKVALRTDAGKLSYLKFADAIDEAGWHDVQVVMDSAAGTLDVWLDGEILHSGSSDGYQIGGASSWDVTAGGKLGSSELNGKIADVSILDTAVDFNSDQLIFDRMVEIDTTDDDLHLDFVNNETQIRYDEDTNIMSLDTDGDLTADMEIELIGVSLSDLENSNFLI